MLQNDQSVTTFAVSCESIFFTTYKYNTGVTNTNYNYNTERKHCPIVTWFQLQYNFRYSCKATRSELAPDTRCGFGVHKASGIHSHLSFVHHFATLPQRLGKFEVTILFFVAVLVENKKYLTVEKRVMN